MGQALRAEGWRRVRTFQGYILRGEPRTLLNFNYLNDSHPNVHPRQRVGVIRLLTRGHGKFSKKVIGIYYRQFCAPPNRGLLVTL